MKKIDTEKLVDEFQSLDADSQLKIVEKIVHELYLNEAVLGNDCYDVVKSSSLKKNLENYIFYLESKPKMKKLKSLLDRFDKLDKKYKISLIEELLDSFEEKLVKQEQEQLLDICENEGHAWGSWKEESQTKYGIYCPADLLNPMRGQPYSYEVPIWVKTCERCGCEETRDYKDVPEEIIEERKQENKEKIKL